jgi:hypothetical protein
MPRVLPYTASESAIYCHAVCQIVARQIIIRDGMQLAAFDLETGDATWQLPVGFGDRQTPYSEAPFTSGIGDEESNWFDSTGRFGAFLSRWLRGYRVTGVDLRRGTVVWSWTSDPFSRRPPKQSTLGYSSPSAWIATESRGLFVCDATDWSREDESPKDSVRVTRIDPKTGESLWTRVVPGIRDLMQQQCLLIPNDESLDRLNATTGKVKWRVSRPSELGDYCVSGSSVFVADFVDPCTALVKQLAGTSGRLIAHGQFNTPKQQQLGILGSGDRIGVRLHRHLAHVFDRDMRRSWQTSPMSTCSWLCFPGEGIALVGGTSLAIHDDQDGRLLGKHPSPKGQFGIGFPRRITGNRSFALRFGWGLAELNSQTFRIEQHLEFRGWRICGFTGNRALLTQRTRLVGQKSKFAIAELPFVVAAKPEDPN